MSWCRTRPAQHRKPRNVVLCSARFGTKNANHTCVFTSAIVVFTSAILLDAQMTSTLRGWSISLAHDKNNQSSTVWLPQLLVQWAREPAMRTRTTCRRRLSSPRTTLHLHSLLRAKMSRLRPGRRKCCKSRTDETVKHMVSPRLVMKVNFAQKARPISYLTRRIMQTCYFLRFSTFVPSMGFQSPILRQQRTMFHRGSLRRIRTTTRLQSVVIDGM